MARYREFIKAGISGIDDTDLSNGGLVRSYGGLDSIKELRQEHEVRIGDERILGGSDFVKAELKKGWNLKKLVKAVCDYFEVKQSGLKLKGRENSLSNAKKCH